MTVGCEAQLPLDQVLVGDCVEILERLPAGSVDLVFADPPYNLQIEHTLLRPNQTRVAGVDDAWDRFAGFTDYDAFTRAWLGACRRVLKEDGSIWVIGTYHNIFRVGAILLDLGYWILNDVIWHKANPMPNFRGTRFTNATETLIWAKRARSSRYTFDYHAMKHFNDDRQMANVWHIPLCRGEERLRLDGQKAHSTQKPEALLYRVILASSRVGDVVLDPFFGSGTTGAVAKRLKRHFIGIERDPRYATLARARIEAIPAPNAPDALFVTPSKRTQPRVLFGDLVAAGYVQVGQTLYSPDRCHTAVVRADGQVALEGASLSIHRAAAHVLGKPAFNGWEFWHVEDGAGQLAPIDVLRERYRQAMAGTEAPLGREEGP